MRKESYVLIFGTALSILSLIVFKEAFTHEAAESIIKEGIGSHFDPDVGAVFMEHSRKFMEISKNFLNKFR